MPGVSRWSFSYGLEFSLPLGDFARGAAGYIGFDGSYRSRFSSNPSRSIYTDVAGYELANFRAGVRTDSGWDIYVWLRNAVNTDYLNFSPRSPGTRA